MCEKVPENGYFFSHWDLEGGRLFRTLVYGQSTVLEEERLSLLELCVGNLEVGLLYWVLGRICRVVSGIGSLFP